MLEKIDLTKSLDKETYKTELKQLETELKRAQQSIREHNIPVILLFEGWSSAGKGTLIGKVVYPLDPRYFNVLSMNKLSEDSIMRPPLWTYWINTPSEGRITLFDKSWHRAGITMSEADRNKYFYDVNAFEEQLISGGTLIIKIFLHISAKEQKKRLKDTEANNATKWRVDDKDWEQNKNYDKYLVSLEQMINETNTAKSKWVIVEAEDKRYATVKTYKTIINKIQEEIKRRGTDNKATYEKTSIKPNEISILRSIDLSKKIENKDYKEKLAYYQNKISDLGYKMYAKRKSVVIVYEGWDAGGKGGNIKRLTEQIDPRGYEVIPIQAPTKEELAHHYLWRFWKFMPKDGHMAIFDRSWYGRVMVERIEGFCTEEDWMRSYKEINDMELHMANHGTIIFKFWMHINKDEQLLRFRQRQDDPLKQYKITDEDWRNREKWDAYEEAVDEMLFRTNTSSAPWTIIESVDKKYARIRTLAIVVKELEKRLK